MCGIDGMFCKNGISKQMAIHFEKMMCNLESRGRDSFGYYTYPKKENFKIKGCVTDFIEPTNRKDKRKKTHFYNKFVDQKIVLGHCRATTKGSEENNINNHPFETENFVLAHNGMIRNDEHLKAQHKFDYKVETDSYIIIALIQKHYEQHGNVIKSIQEMAKEVAGQYACWLLHKDSGKLYLFRYLNPTIIGYIPTAETFVFASEYDTFSFIKEIYKDKDYKNKFSKSLFAFETDSKRIYEIDFEHGIKKYEFEPNTTWYEQNPRRNYGRTIFYEHELYGEDVNAYGLGYPPDKPPLNLSLPNRSEISSSTTEDYDIYDHFDEDLITVLYYRGLTFSIDSDKMKITIRVPLDFLKPLRKEGVCISQKDGHISLNSDGFDHFVRVIEKLNIRTNTNDFNYSKEEETSD